MLRGSHHVWSGFGQVSEQDCPHLLFYGPSGSGKKTLILALIKQMFGAGSEKVRFFK
jgi:DNA polymerase III delta prime subunit